MNRPKMILFDYGDTLAHESSPDLLRAERAVFPYITENPRHVTPEEAAALGEELFQRANASRVLGFEIHEWPMLRCKYEALGIRFSISLEKVETLLCENITVHEPMPHIEELLGYLREEGIPTGVVSNIGWSGKTLERTLEKLLPEHRFAFVLASSEYVVRKPDPILFSIALQRAGFAPEEVWFCGDNPEADIAGARASGLFPVLYRPGGEPADCLTVGDWRELMEILKKL